MWEMELANGLIQSMRLRGFSKTLKLNNLMKNSISFLWRWSDPNPYTSVAIFERAFTHTHTHTHSLHDLNLNCKFWSVDSLFHTSSHSQNRFSYPLLVLTEINYVFHLNLIGIRVPHDPAFSVRLPSTLLIMLMHQSLLLLHCLSIAVILELYYM